MNKEDKTCKLCESKSLKSVIDFGNVALAGAFLQSDDFPNEQKHQLEVFFCENCYGLQVGESVPPSVLFHDYFYFSSAIKTLRDHYIEYANEVVSKLNLDKPNATMVEIGCNDGVLLKPLADLGVGTLVGVDPATNVVETINDERIEVENTFFNVDSARQIKSKYGSADVIMANNVFAHIDDIRSVVEGLELLLNDDGVFVCEVHYISHLIEELQYDFIYHEHLFYYSFLSLENLFAAFDMEIFDVKPISIHAGSMRYYVRKKGGLEHLPISEMATSVKSQELGSGYHKLETYNEYADKVADRKDKLMTLLTGLKAKNNQLAGYGASGRANTVLQYCGIDHQLLDFMIDDAPAKHGYCTPGTHIPIHPRTHLENDSPDYIVIFAWSFFKEIAAKNMDYLENGGLFIVPLPEVAVYGLVDGKLAEMEIDI